MRKVNNLADVQIVLNDLLNWKDKITTSPLDMTGRKIVNGAPATNPNDFVIFSQLPAAPPIKAPQKEPYTQVFSNGGTATTGMILPPFVVGREREGTPTEIWLVTNTAPVGGPLSMNLQLNGALILTSDISIPSGQTGPVFTHLFISPIPTIKHHAVMQPIVTAGNGAIGFSMGLVVKR